MTIIRPTTINARFSQPVGLGGEKLWLCPTLGGDRLDLSGNGNHGTYNGGMGTVADTNAGGVRAYSFDGVDDYILSYDSGINGSGGWANFLSQHTFSVALWYQIDPYIGNSIGAHFWGTRSRGGYYGYSGSAEGISKNAIWTYRFNASDNFSFYYGASSSSTGDTNWHHLCWSVTNGTCKLFIDGTLDSTLTPSTLPSQNIQTSMYFGRLKNWRYLNGRLDDIRVFGRALTTTEIIHLASKRGVLGSPRQPYDPLKRTVVRVPAAIPAATVVGSIKKPKTIIKPSYQAGYARNASESENPNLWDGLVGAWMPSLGVTGETLRDVSGNGNHGTLTNMEAASDWVATSKGLALDFDGTNEMVDVDSPPVISGSSATYSLWVKANSVYSWMSPCGYVTSGFDDYRFIFRRTNGGLIQTVVNRSNRINFNAAPPSGFSWYDWNHFLIVADGSLSQTYVNGSFLASNNSGSGNLNFGTTFTLGNQDLRPGGSTWNGGITNVKLYNRAISPTEIKHLYVDSLAPFRRKQRVSVAVPAAVAPSATYHPLRSLAHPLEQ